MPERQTESAPDPSARLPKVWETGESPEESRIPGTRRLWLAGALLVAVLASAVTAVTVLDSGTDDVSRDRAENPLAADEPLVPDLPPAPAPSGKSGLAAPGSTGTGTDGAASPAAQQGAGDPEPVARPSTSEPAPARRPPSPTSPSGSSSAGHASSRKSVQAVNYPDRYWRSGHDSVRLDRMDPRVPSRAGQETSFRLVPGLADAHCVSFSLGDGRYLRHSGFRLRADRHDGSGLFRQDATFCPRASAFPGAVMLESVNYRGRFLRHRDFSLRLDPYENSRLYRGDSAFRLVRGLG